MVPPILALTQTVVTARHALASTPSDVMRSLMEPVNGGQSRQPTGHERQMAKDGHSVAGSEVV